jgi:acyl-CoA synthetase (AMP-forming)/AMP-acid ligase II
MSYVTNLAKNLTDTARNHAERAAVRVDDAAMTYQALDEASARVAGLLHERGLKPGDRVGIMMPNVAEVPVVYYGVLRAGGVVVPMNPLLKAREVAYYLGDSGAGLIFAWHAFADQARGGAEQAEAEPIVVDAVSFPDLLASVDPDYAVADRDDEDTAVILYTSGTTGHPKGAELTHGNLISNTEVSCTDIVRARPDDVIFGGLPLFHTGDLARVDEDGYFYIVDRKKDLIIRGGYNVYPREIEEVLYEHPAVAEAAVIGLPHPALGEEVGAAVALKPGAAITAEELRDYVKGQVAAYKYPRHVWMTDALPKGPTGKIQKRDIVVPAGLTGPAGR